MILKQVIKLLATVLCRLNIDLLINKKKVVVLMYHGVSRLNVQKEGENYDGKHVFVAKFERQLAYLKDRYQFISLENFCEFLDAKKKIPENSVLLTFDDGYRNNIKTLFPVLQKYNIPATIFVCTGLIGKEKPNWPDLIEWGIVQSKKNEVVVEDQVFSLAPTKKKMSIIGIKNLFLKLPSFKRERMLNDLLNNLDVKPDFQGNYQLMGWNEIKKMQQTVSFGSHSQTHPILPVESLNKIRKEVTVSKQVIEKKIGRKVLAFAYPNGIYDEKTKNLVREAGYSCAFAAKWGKIDETPDRFALERIPVNGNDSPEFFFLNLILNAHRFVHKIKGLL